MKTLIRWAVLVTAVVSVVLLAMWWHDGPFAELFGPGESGGGAGLGRGRGAGRSGGHQLFGGFASTLIPMTVVAAIVIAADMLRRRRRRQRRCAALTG